MRWVCLIVGAICGAILGSTNVFAPLHEFYHVAVAGKHGIEAVITSWSTAELAEFNFPAIFAGWSAQMWSGAIAAVVFAVVGRHTRAMLFTGAGGVGYAAAAWGRAFGSYDFNEAIKLYLARALSSSDQLLVWGYLHEEITRRWTVIGLLVIGLAVLVVVVMVWRDKRKFSLDF